MQLADGRLVQVWNGAPVVNGPEAYARIFDLPPAAAAGAEDTAFEIPLTAALTDTDGSESFVLVLTGFPDGAVFNAGALDEASGSPTLGDWIISQAQIEALGGSPLTMAPPQNWNGSFALSVEMTVTDSATLSTGAATNSILTTTTIDVTIDPVNDAPVTVADSYSTDEDTPLTISAVGVLINDTDVDGDALTAALVNGPANGSLTLNADGSFTYTPDANFYGQDSFTYKTNDGTADGNSETVTINVNPVNDAPVTNADSYSTSEDTTLVIGGPGVLANDTDAENDPLTAAIVTGPLNGSLTLNADGSFTYTPDANFFGIDSFTYKTNDGTVDGNTETVTINVNPVDDVPVTSAIDAGTVSEDDAVETIDLLAGQTDVDGDTLSATGISVVDNNNDPVNFTDNGDGTISIDPDQFGDALTNGQSRTVTVSYGVSDGAATIANTATLVVTGADDNSAPTTGDILASGDEDTAVTVSLTGSDGDGNLDGFVLKTLPANGTLYVDAGLTNAASANVLIAGASPLTLYFKPDADWSGSTSFTYAAHDDTGTEDATPATATIDVAPVADAPAITAPGLVAAQATPLGGDSTINTGSTSGQAPAIAGIDGGFVATWTSFGQDNGISGGVYAQRFNADGTPVGGEVLVNTYTAGDQQYSAVVAIDGGYAITWQSVGNDGSGWGIFVRRYASDGTPLDDAEIQVNTTTAFHQSNPEITAIDGGFVVVWKSDPTNTGDDVFSRVFAADGTAVTGEIQANTHTSGDHLYPSVASFDSGYVVTWVSAGQDGSGYGVISRRFGNDGTPLGNEVQVNTTTTFAQVWPQAAGIEGGYVITWASHDSDGDLYGVYAQRYADDGTRLGEETLVNTVTDGNQTHPSVAATADGYIISWTSAGQDGDGSGIYAQRFASDGTRIGGEFRVNATTAGSQYHSTDTAGSGLAVLPDGTLAAIWRDSDIDVRLFHLAEIVRGQEDQPVALDGLSAAVSDTDGSESLAALTLAGVPAGATLSDGTNTVVSTGVDIDIFGWTLSALTLALGDDVNGTFTLTLKATVTDSATLSGGNAGDTTTGETSFDVVVMPVNDAPVTVADSYSTDEDTPLTISSVGVLINDTDVDGDALTAALVGGPANGSLTLNADGSFTYTPDVNFHGQDSFTYKTNDGTEDGNTETVTIDVNPVNDAPVTVADSYSTDEDTPLTIAANGVLANDTDVEGDALTAALFSGPANGSLTLNSDGSFTYTPDANFFGQDSFTYKTNDGTEDGNTATVTINVNPVNDAPVTNDDSLATSEDTPLTIGANQLLDNDTDADGDSLSVASFDATSANGGTVALLGNGDIKYTPPANFYGQDSFTYTTNDGTEDGSTATVTINVNPVNDTPVTNDDSYFALEDATGIFSSYVSLLGNDTDADGDSLTAVLVDDVQHGTLDLGANGTFTYTPEADFSGTDTFTYKTNDGTEDGNTATVTIDVAPVADSPTLEIVGSGADRLFFSATDGSNGLELWSYDGTNTPMMVHDINPSFQPSSAGRYGGLIEYDGKIFFSATDGSNGYELWSYDGTDTPQMVFDINSGAASSEAGRYGGLIEYDGKIFFSAWNGSDGYELWSYDGTNTPQMVHDINSGAAGSEAGRYQSLIEFDGKLYFSASDGSNGFELWSYDGTNPPMMVHDINSGAAGSEAGRRQSLTEFGGKLYFSAYDGSNGSELWSYDGTNAPEMVADINPGSGSSEAGIYGGLIAFGGKLYFCATEGSNGFELWSYDGTNAPEMVADINPGSGSSEAGIYGGLIAFGGKLYFCATEGSNGFELWSYDGTNAPEMVADINPGIGGSFAGRFGGFFEFGGKLYFSATDGSNGLELWSYDGTNPPTMVYDILPGSAGSGAGAGGLSYLSGLAFAAFSGGGVGGDEDTAIEVPITAQLSDTDGSESFVLVLTGFPAGATFNAGALDADSGSATFGAWVITEAEFTALAGANVTVTPPQDWNGQFDLGVEMIVTDTANYDGGGSDTDSVSTSTTVDVTVTPVNDAPVANNDSVSTSEDTTLVIAANQLLANDADAESDTLTITALTDEDGNASNGITTTLGATITLNGDGSIGYDPTGSATLQALNNGETLDDTFTYTASDGNGGTDTATVSVTVNGVGDANVSPVISDLSTSVTFLENTVNAAPQLIDADVTVGDLDSANFDGGTLRISGFESGEDSISILHGGAGGAISFTFITLLYNTTFIGSASGGRTEDFVVTFSANATPEAVEAVIESLTFRNNSNSPIAARTLTIELTDGDGGTVSQNVVVNVTPEAEASASATDDLIYVTDDTAVTIPWSALIANDSYNGAGTLSISAVTALTLWTSDSNITLTNNVAAQTITFTTPDLAGNDLGTFDYTLSDGLGVTSEGSVVVNVLPTNSPSGVIINLQSNHQYAYLDFGGGDDAYVGGSGRDYIIGGPGADTLTGGSGADTFAYTAGDTALTVSSSGGDDGTVSGYDVITDFVVGTHKLELPVTPVLPGDSAGPVDGTDSVVRYANGASNVIAGHVTYNGMIAFFAIGDTFAITDIQRLAAAVDYLERNDLGDAGTTVAFLATIGAVPHTFVYQQVGDTPSASNDILIDLQGVTVYNLSTLIGTTIDPIVIDLDGDGLHFTAASRFDLDNDGDADSIGWPGAGDGLLVVDLDGSGMIENGSEVFSPQFDSGGFATSIEALGSWDDNGDGEITALDAGFGTIRVWVDANSDGMSDAGELQSLSGLGIVSIGLGITETDYSIDGQHVFAEGLFKMSDGSSRGYFGLDLGPVKTSETRTVTGGEGDEILAAILGHDTLTGGAGADMFVLDETALGDAGLGIRDLIADYDFDEGDMIDLSALLGGAPVDAGNAADYVRLNGSCLEVDIDGSGQAAGFVEVAEFSVVPGTDALRILVDHQPDPSTVWI